MKHAVLTFGIVSHRSVPIIFLPQLLPPLPPQVGKLCATPYGVDIVGITEAIALVGALVGGYTSRKRKEEVERLNEQLRWEGRGGRLVPL